MTRALAWAAVVVVLLAAVRLPSAAGARYATRTYAIHDASMEPTLHCARPGLGCLARYADRVVARVPAVGPLRGDIVVVAPPIEAVMKCGAGGGLVTRLIGLPGETIAQRRGAVLVNGRELREPYVQAARRDSRYGTWHVSAGQYFLMGDNRVQSCDSREWGAVRRASIIGKVVRTIRVR